MSDPVFLNWLLYRPIVQGDVFETLKQKSYFEIRTAEHSSILTVLSPN